MAIAVSSTGTNLELPKKHTLPGHTIDALLGLGDIAAAQAELERLIDQGASEDEKNLIEVTPHYWRNMRTRARA